VTRPVTLVPAQLDMNWMILGVGPWHGAAWRLLEKVYHIGEGSE